MLPDDLVRAWEEWARNDPEYNLYMEEIRRFRAEADERFQREATSHGCSVAPGQAEANSVRCRSAGG
jgi:hypothetical protein